MDISVAQDGVLYHGYALHDGVDAVGAFLRVSLALEQKRGLELYEVFLVVVDILSEILGCVVPRKLVGVLPSRQQQHP